MNFTGCGEITDWIIEGRGNGDLGRVKIELQLFRPDPTQSTVFTEVTSSIVTTSVAHNIRTHTFASIGFTFSPGYVLGFHYPNNMGGFLEVSRTNSYSTHSLLTSATTPTTSTVTATAPAGTSRLFVPLMSVSGELSYLMLVHSVLYSHHCVCGYLLCVVSCTVCPRSSSITGTVSVSHPDMQTTTPSSSSGTASAIITPTNSIGIPTSSNTADPSGSDISVGVPIAVVLVLFILAVVVAVVIIVIVIVSVRRKNSGEVSLRAVYESPLDNSYDTISEFLLRIHFIFFVMAMVVIYCQVQ